MQFTVSGKEFLLDGKPVKIFSSAVHYFRNMPDTWGDIFEKLKACGCNCVETYCPWNQHEKVKGQFDFSGILDIVAFLQKAQSYGLMAIVRPGPYICAEFDFGGLPWWLHTEKDMEIRCANENFMRCFDGYLDELLSRLKPLLCTNGGNIIMMQVENEYGSYGDDKTYLRHIRDGYRRRGIDVELFTSDGESYGMLTDGGVEGCLPTVNFGSCVAENFKTHDELYPDVPKMCMETWCGWFDAWGDTEHHTRDAQDYAKTVDDMLQKGSANTYMFIGGTNFAFTAGANYSERFTPDVTSYDYDALLTECGDVTEKYLAVREVAKKYFGELPPVPANRKKKGYGRCKAQKSAGLFDNLDRLSTPKQTRSPRPMEEYGIGSGFILYRTRLNRTYENQTMRFTSLGDRALVYLNGRRIGRVYVNDERLEVTFSAKAGDTLDIVCENLARVNYGPKMMEKKGISGRLLFGCGWANVQHFGWTGYPLPMDNLDGLVWEEVKGGEQRFYRFTLQVEGTPCDTFLRTDNFRKGFVVVNGFNLGRYWEIGPQKTLYVPAGVLKEGENEILLFDGDGIKGEAEIEFVDTPDLG